MCSWLIQAVAKSCRQLQTYFFLHVLFDTTNWCFLRVSKWPQANCWGFGKITNIPGHQLSIEITMTLSISLVYSTPLCIYHTSYWIDPFLLTGDLLSKSVSPILACHHTFFLLSSVSIINRPGAAGATLQTPSSLINWVILYGNISHTLSLPNRES